MNLSIINSGGISAYCSDCIVDENRQVYFLSVAGYQTAVKGIIANVLEYSSVSVEICEGYEYLFRSPQSYSVYYQKLPSGLYQGVVLPTIALPGNNEPKDTVLILSRHTSAAKELFFKHLEEKTEIPLHPSWSGWLCGIFSEREWLTPLDSLIGEYQGYVVDIYENQLKDTITMAIANKDPEVMVCFKKGGEHGSNE
jgi:hypothetical protein